MPILYISKEDHHFEKIENFDQIKEYVTKRGIMLEKWEASSPIDDGSTQDEILKAYDHKLKPFMNKNGFQSADVVNIHNKTENIEAIREKFLKEHTHSEDEVRFFIDGAGKFWFHLDSGEVFCLYCQKGDFISVPKGFKHWFDLAPDYHVKAIRIFLNTEGWIAQYTDSGVDIPYNKAEL
ncbi:MAG: 1,2-dihydroxy-3-keto-5-methylthiopentene dioxygenase [Bacteriovoracaceae bacterium]